MNPDRPCPHGDFEAVVEIDVIGEGETTDGMPEAYLASITVKCADCGERFRWMGVPAGLNGAFPTCSPSEFELRAPIRPSGNKPDPGFSIRSYGGDNE